VLVLAMLAQSRSEDNTFRPGNVVALFDDLALPRPARTDNILARLRRDGVVVSLRRHGQWRVSPAGAVRAEGLLTDIDIAALGAEAMALAGPRFGHAIHPVMRPSLAPLGLLPRLRTFLADHPFDRNVLGMTRFPDEEDHERGMDPVAGALEAANAACADHRLEFHLASDRAIDAELWGNVNAHMWASRYGIGFFENRRERGLNYNLTIEVGAMLMAGRPTLLLKDESIGRMPTDLVGRIYKSVDLEEPDTVSKAIHTWIRDDLNLGECPRCPRRRAA
jgi:hypothetical protein